MEALARPDVASWVLVRRPSGLARIAGTNLCVWRRPLRASLRAWVARELARGLVLESSCTSRSGPSVAARLCEHLGPSPGMTLLAADIARLVDRLRAVTARPILQASLATVDTDKCRKFHVDYKAVRLVCTYGGPGTEWVDDAGVDRAMLGQPAACIDSANAKIVPRPAAVHRALPGDVVLLKGEQDNEGRGVVHRSPPIEATRERRLVLTVDVR